MYACTSFRGSKTCKIGKKGMFLVIDKFWRGNDGQFKKNACENAYLGSIFLPEKKVFSVCFESPFTRMISSLKYKCPPGLYSANCTENKQRSHLFYYENIMQICISEFLFNRSKFKAYT